MSAALALPALIYGGLVAGRNRLYDAGLLPRARAPRPTVSIGNLTVGGSGKTPLVLHIATRLTGDAVPVAVLTRGYGRRSTAPLVVAAGEPLPSAAIIGDEPWLLRRSIPSLALGIGADRLRSASSLAPALGAGVFLLDDGFQHRRLQRDLDLVVVAAGEPLAKGKLLPWGRLRESPRGLARAHRVVIVAAPGNEGDVESTRAEVSRLAPALPVATARVTIRGVRPFAARPGDLEPMTALSGPLALAASIARPGRVARGLEALGQTIAGVVTFHDHHGYTDRDLPALAETASTAPCLVTTEKDEGRLLAAFGSALPSRLERPIWVLVTELEFQAGGEELYQAVLAARDRQSGE